MIRHASHCPPCGLPDHVTRRGNRREQVFFNDEDYAAYLNFLREALAVSGAQVWAWCLMPNHVHLVIVPADEDGLRATVANTHRRHAARINARNTWTGHLWQGRYGSVVMDEAHLYHAFAYVTLNPVRARLVEKAEDWPWSSIHAHLGEADDGITHVAAAQERVGDFAGFLELTFDAESFEPLRRSEVIGRPLGSAGFIAELEQRFQRTLKKQKPGPKKKDEIRLLSP